MDDNLKLFIPFEKKNSDKRIVEGYASTEAMDTQGEIVKLKAIEKALPDYMKFGNIREMHQWSAVGKTTHAKVDHKKKGLFIKAKIIGQEAWEKCKEGVYNGFSIGGKIVSKVGDSIEELVLNEISIVDRPANPQATFSLIKMQDGKVVEEQMQKLEESLLEKSIMDEEAGMSEEMPHSGVMSADRLIAMAATVAYMIDRAKQYKKTTNHLDKVLTSLKMAAKHELEMDKLSKKDDDEKKDDKDLATKLKEVKEKLERAVQSKSYEKDWDKKYFETLRENL